ncbi:hypothetical protein PF008_g6711 [Phytophthora fragariae]|uniref:Uncharacterized protein n=1 Tax=Phytophthora fragariae TaxID=53985 RepID=A0A6G0S572_9STRA|nr:hypothetical protein PF008_g6711 [Phytophthora fragariae]
MDTLHAQKENVDVSGGGIAGKLNFAATAGTDKLATPKRVFVIHEDTKSSSKKGLKDSSTKKRRVLGDISNKQQNHQADSNSGGVPSAKKTGLVKGLGYSKKLSAKKQNRTPLKSKTPLKSRTAASLKPEAVIKLPRAEEVPDIEFAYGGLPSPTSDSAYVKGLRDEIVKDILNDKTPTLFDDFDFVDVIDAWDDGREKAMLESGEPPSPWWASVDPQKESESNGADTIEEEHEEDDLSELPPPDNLPDDTPKNFDDDGLLEDLLSVDVEAACEE